MAPRRDRFEKFYPLLVLAVVFAVCWIVSPADRKTGASIFASPENLLKLLRQVSEIGLLAIGETLVILTAGIDLSVGSVLGASSMAAGFLLVDGGHSAPVAVAGALATGLAFGLLNGAFIVMLKIQPFVATLATFGAARGFARLLKENASIGLDEAQAGFLVIGRSFREAGAWLRGEELSNTSAKSLADFATIPGALFLTIGMIVYFTLTRTSFGRSVYAIGGNIEAARLSGIAVKRNLLFVYGACGLLAALAGIVHCAQLEQSNPVDGEGYELRAIAAVAIGGTLLTGGRGGVFATICGVLTLGCLSSILGIHNVRAEMQLILIAVILILAVKLPDWILSFASKKLNKS